jgi:hypothetical protein
MAHKLNADENRQLRHIFGAGAAHEEDHDDGFGSAYRVGDLEDVVQMCWAAMTPDQQAEVYIRAREMYHCYWDPARDDAEAKPEVE